MLMYGLFDDQRSLRSTGPLTVPLLCSGRRLQAEGANQIQGGVAQAHPVQRRPQVDHVPLALTLGVKALVLVQVQVHAEGAAAAIAAMNRAGTAPLRAAPPQTLRQAEVIEQPGYRQLRLQVREVEPYPLDRFGGVRYSDSAGRGDLWPCRHVRLEARGLFYRHIGIIAFAVDNVRRRVPRLMIRVKRLAGLPDRERQMQQLPHHMPDGDGRLVRMLDSYPRVQRLARRVEPRRREGRHPQI